LFHKEIVMRYNKAVLAVAIGAAAVTAWAAPGFGPDLFGLGEGAPRGGDHHRQHEQRSDGDRHEGHRHEGHRHDGHRHEGPRHGAGPMSPERADARLDRMAERLVRSVDGTPEQQQKVSEIAKAAARDLRELRGKGDDLRRQGMDLLKAPTIDRTALEGLRSQQMAVADAVSKRMATAFADAAEVLTPEQRGKLAEHLQARRGGARRG
jgi:Spy/CpxP family protein refolding chaperone